MCQRMLPLTPNIHSLLPFGNRTPEFRWACGQPTNNHIPQPTCSKMWPYTFVSCGCHAKCLQTWCLKTTKIYSPVILKAISPKSRCQQSHVPSEGSRKQSSLVSSTLWWSQRFLDLWQHNSMPCVRLCMAFSSVHVSSPLLSLTWTLVIGYGAHLGNPR